MVNVAIFVSGSGTNCENIIRHFSGSADVRVALVLEVEDEGLEEEHPGNGDDHREEQVELDFVLRGEETRLLLDHARVQGEVDEHVDQLRRIAVLRHARVPVLERIKEEEIQIR